MSPRAKKDDNLPEVVVEDDVISASEISGIAVVSDPVDPEATSDKGERFNEHVKALVQNFVQQEIAGLEERVRDLEGLVVALMGKTGAATPEDSATPPTPVSTGDDVPDYVQTHQQDDGLPWYRG